MAMTAMFSDQRYRAERDCVLPDLRDLVARLRHDLDRADALAVDDDRHVTALRPARRSALQTTPARALILRRVGARRRTVRIASGAPRGVLHPDPHVAHQPQCAT